MIRYDQKKADRAVQFIKILRHTKGDFARKPFNLQDYQEEPIRDIFGRVNDEGHRIVREAFFMWPRKMGKSEMAAAIALMGLFLDDEYGAEIYSAANSREQASLVFQAACAMVRMNPILKKKCKILKAQKRIVRYDTNSFYRAISADSSTADGFNAHMVIYDEVHEAKNRDLYDKLKTSMGARSQPLFICITTAGQEAKGLWYELFVYSKKIKEGIVEDPSFYPSLYYAEKDVDWTDEEIWKRVNPSIDAGYRNLEEMQNTCKQALEIPSLEAAFRRMYLNQIISNRQVWLPFDRWKESGRDIPMSKLLKRHCYAGLDLSSTYDITALVLVFPLPDGEYATRYYYFIPEDNLHERVRRDRVQYDVWLRQGHMFATPGNVVDYDYIHEKVRELSKVFDIRAIAFDPWKAIQLTTQMETEGYNMVSFSQTIHNFAGPTDELIKLTLKQKLHNGGHPVTNWMSSNMILRQDATGNLRPDKEKSIEKIDGMVALIMGLELAIRDAADGPSVYEERGIRAI